MKSKEKQASYNFFRKTIFPVVLIILSFIYLLFSIINNYGVGGKFISIFLLIIAIFWIVFNFASNRNIRFALIMPTTLILIAVTIIPFIYLVYLSFYDVTALNFNKDWHFIGLKNYGTILFGNVEVRDSFIRTFEFIIYSIGAQFVIAMGMALLINREFKGKGIFTSLLLLPMISSPIVVGMIWKYLLTSNHGIVNQILEIININRQPWLTNEPLPFVKDIPIVGMWLVKYLNLNYGFLSIVITDIWQWTPFMFLIFLAGLHSAPPEPYEAAKVDGASYIQTFRYITLPHLRNVILIALLIRIMDSLKVFDTIWALFGNSINVRTINLQLYTVGLSLRHYSEGAALSIIILIFVSILSSFIVRYIYKK